MKSVMRSIQTCFPFLHDARYKVKAWKMRLTGKPVEYDFYALKKLMPTADEVIVDIGVNRGQALLSILLCSDSQCPIVGFEPNPIVYQKVSRQSFARQPRVTLHNCGLGDESGQTTLYIPYYRKWMFDGLASVHYQEAENWLVDRLWRYDPSKFSIKEVNCEIRRLDEFDLKPFFIKIDVQGHELHVLRGGQETIAKFKPTLLIECITPEIMDLLRPQGYEFYAYQNRSFTPGTGIPNTFCMTQEVYDRVQQA